MACFKPPKIGIVGAGPAGISAGIFLKRYDFDVTVFEKKQIGGLILNAWQVENIPLIEPSKGEQIVNTFKKYINIYQLPIIFEEVIEVSKNLILTKNKKYEFDEIIIASGTLPRRIPNFEICNKIVYEFNDLPDNINSIAIYGAGDVAFDSAIKIANSGITVHVFNRGKKIKSLKKLFEIAMKLGVTYHENEPIIDVTKNTENKLIVQTSKNVYRFDSLLLAIGRIGNTSFVKTENVYFAGDAAHPNIRQASIAVGDGIKVAMEIIQKYMGGFN